MGLGYLALVLAAADGACCVATDGQWQRLTQRSRFPTHRATYDYIGTMLQLVFVVSWSAGPAVKCKGKLVPLLTSPGHRLYSSDLIRYWSLAAQCCRHSTLWPRLIVNDVMLIVLSSHGRYRYRLFGHGGIAIHLISGNPPLKPRPINPQDVHISFLVSIVLSRGVLLALVPSRNGCCFETC